MMNCNGIKAVSSRLRLWDRKQMNVAAHIGFAALATLCVTSINLSTANAASAPAANGLAVGGPFEAITGRADPAFKALFQSWKKLDQIETGVIAIPSSKPVKSMVLTSSFGVRADPFKGGRAMHAGLDISGPIGTPIYATADGIVGRAQWANGYGNLVELEHGKGIQTRFGHLSKILVQPMTRVKRGDLIALMGSTGRSTGSHLHYEVRIDGRAVNPLPFLQSTDYLMNIQAHAADSVPGVALGGPKR
ncbi:M23 family metallopeptidase [Aquisediminimonas sediminicola]|uniref:M23 family metallopeptidase n=1 Tax=Alteraquisediminimonas sediminicola TaxID=2676787 RepID=UPI001C8D6735